MWDDPLNDMSGPVAVHLAGLMAPSGAILGMAFGPAAVDGSSLVGRLLAAAIGLGAMLGVLGWYLLMLRREDRRLRTELVVGSHELMTGGEHGVTVPARVEQKLSASVGGGTPLDVPGLGRCVQVLATALAPEGPRRVLAAVPWTAVPGVGQPVPLALHPRRRDVAVADTRVPPEEVGRGDADPRWSGPLPTSRTITGGWWTKVVAPGASLLAFAALSVALQSLL